MKSINSLYLLTNGGVGYEVFVPIPLLDTLQTKERVQLFIYTHYREHEVSLYGFQDLKKRAFFLELLSIKGIGPKMALEVVACPAHILEQAFLNNDPVLLTEIRGMGKKTAERLLLELKNVDITLFSEESESPISDHKSEVVEALAALGYEKNDIYRALQQVPADFKDAETIIKWFLTREQA